MPFEKMPISEFKKKSVKELTEGLSLTLTSEGEDIGFFIMPPSGFIRNLIEERVCEGEQALGKRK